MSEWTIVSPPEPTTAAQRASALFHLRSLRELGWTVVRGEGDES